MYGVKSVQNSEGKTEGLCPGKQSTKVRQTEREETSVGQRTSNPSWSKTSEDRKWMWKALVG